MASHIDGHRPIWFSDVFRTGRNPAQESITPIVTRPDLKMHLRHKSIPGLLLNQALVNELSRHYAFCHCQIAARSIHKHYIDHHPHVVPLAAQYQT